MTYLMNVMVNVLASDDWGHRVALFDPALDTGILELSPLFL